MSYISQKRGKIKENKQEEGGKKEKGRGEGRRKEKEHRHLLSSGAAPGLFQALPLQSVSDSFQQTL